MTTATLTKPKVLINHKTIQPCPHCINGQLFTETDGNRHVLFCLQCGYRMNINKKGHSKYELKTAR